MNQWIKSLVLSLLMISLTQAETLIDAGVITVDSVWTLAGSPYIVQGDVQVYGSTNPTLTIEAGCEILFNPNTEIRVGILHNWESDSYRGSLVAIGTAVDPILFSSTDGTNNSWDGLFFSQCQ